MQSAGLRLSRRRMLQALAVAAVGCALTLAEESFAEPLARPAVRPAVLSPQALHGVMQAVAFAGTRLVAVGERGIVLLSDDGGRTWRQVGTPVSVTLTCVQFVDARRGWAAGHAGVILHTDDGGEHWTRQLDGAGAAELALVEARTRMQGSPDQKGATNDPTRLLANAERLVAEGADKPFFSIWFTNANRGTAVGAYGIAVHTEDGGKTWQSWTARLNNPRSLHLYAVRQQGDVTWIAGEQGFMMRTDDNGHQFSPAVMPYKGSLFTMDVAPNGTVAVGGLLGNLLRSTDGGATFAPSTSPSPLTISDILFSRDGLLLVVDQSGQVFVSRDQGTSFTERMPRPPFPINGIAQQADAVVGAGFGGVVTIGSVGSKNTPVEASASHR